jgi:hypothetical protein
MAGAELPRGEARAAGTRRRRTSGSSYSTRRLETWARRRRVPRLSSSAQRPGRGLASAAPGVELLDVQDVATDSPASPTEIELPWVEDGVASFPNRSPTKPTESSYPPPRRLARRRIIIHNRLLVIVCRIALHTGSSPADATEATCSSPWRCAREGRWSREGAREHRACVRAFGRAAPAPHPCPRHLQHSRVFRRGAVH